MIAGPVARAQGAISAFQQSLGEVVSAVAEEQERAEHAEARVREIEAELERQAREFDRRERGTYRRGYNTGHAAGRQGRDARPLRAVEGAA